MTVAATPAHGRIREAVVYFLRLGLLGFGGPVALVGQMERELVAERKWLTNEQMREAIAILHSCYRLAKLGMEDWLQWAIAVVCLVVTVALQAEVALLFIGAGIVGVLYYGDLFRRRPPAALQITAVPVLAQLAPVASGSTLVKLLLFFLKAGSLTFGSGLVIVPFLEQGLVREYGWLDPRQFLAAVAIGMISPGPVVITATFVGYLVAGFWGSLVSTIGIFFPSFILVLVAAPLLARHRGN